MRKVGFFFGVASFVALVAACGDDDDSWIPKVDAGLDAAKDAPAPVKDASGDGCVTDASVPRVDCTQGSAACPALEPVGETLAPDASAAFHGAADPSVRQDPTSTRIWLAYSYPHVQTTTGTDGGPQASFVSESHLAYSDDFGQTFIYDPAINPMFASSADPADAEAGTPAGAIASENASFVRGMLNGGALWYAVRTSYIAQPTPGLDPKPNSRHFRVSSVTDPTSFRELNFGLEQTLGLSRISPVDVDLDVVAGGALADCTALDDPGIYFDSGKLYVAAQCVSNAAKDRIVLFSTIPTGTARTWAWNYVGVMADTQITKDLVSQLGLDPAVSSLHQTDIARGRDGKLIAIVSPTKNQNNVGCVALEMTSLDPPVFARGCDGKLSVRAYATASDQPNGQSSCGYDPSSATGMLLTRRPEASGTAGFSIRKTGLYP